MALRRMAAATLPAIQDAPRPVSDPAFGVGVGLARWTKASNWTTFATLLTHGAQLPFSNAATRFQSRTKATTTLVWYGHPPGKGSGITARTIPAVRWGVRMPDGGAGCLALVGRAGQYASLGLAVVELTVNVASWVNVDLTWLASRGDDLLVPLFMSSVVLYIVFGPGRLQRKPWTCFRAGRGGPRRCSLSMCSR